MSANGDPTLRSSFDCTAPVLVLRRSPGPFQHGALAVARSLGRVGVPVYAVRADEREPATRSRYVCDALAVPPNGSTRDWAQRLLDLPARFDRAILLPIDDLSAVAVGDHQERLRERFRLPAQPIGVQRRLASKRELWRLCRALSLPTPASTFPTSRGELLTQAADHGYPVVLKRAEPWYPPRDPGAPSVAIAHDRDQLLVAYARMESEVQPQVMLQEYVPGDADSVWMFNGCFGDEARCLCGFTGQKLRQCGEGAGPTSLGRVATRPEVTEAATRLMRELDYRGIVDMGFRYDRRDGSFRLLDVNPRIGSTFRMFTADNGIDVARALHLYLTGRTVPSCANPDGRVWIDERGDVGSVARGISNRSLGVGAWLRSLRRIDEAAWWATDDQRPFYAMAAQLGPHVSRQMARRVTARMRDARRRGDAGA